MGAGFPGSRLWHSRGGGGMGAASSPRLDLSTVWDSAEPPPADPGVSFLLFADFKEAERNAESMLENGSDTLGGGMLKEGSSTVSYEAGVFLACGQDLGRGTPPWPV